jgi:two-component system, OmpR family, sensor histidine kinase CiaH
MFTKARIKLTAWYLLIILWISLSFSVVIYSIMTREFERFSQFQRNKIERQLNEEQAFPPSFVQNGNQFHLPVMGPELVNEVKNRFLLSLILMNCSIAAIAGGLGYFLAGRTLKPIKEMLDEQNRFVSDASHELRTPLTSLKSAMEVSLRDPRLNLADAKTLIRENIDEVNKLQLLSDELLRFAQYKEINGASASEEFLLSGAVSQAIHTIESKAKDKHISIHVTSLQDTYIVGNANAIRDVFVILLDNAVKYSKENTQVTVKTIKKDGHVEVSISDKGIGIDKKDIPHIFERFYRSDNARSKTPNEGGYGLGLSIANKIIKQHKGSIAVASSTKGSVFTLILPAAKHTG